MKWILTNDDDPSWSKTFNNKQRALEFLLTYTGYDLKKKE